MMPDMMIPDMNRRSFLKVLGIMPAAAALPAIIVPATAPKAVVRQRRFIDPGDTCAVFQEQDFSDADFASLVNVRMVRCNLKGARFTGDLLKCSFEDCGTVTLTGFSQSVIDCYFEQSGIEIEGTNMNMFGGCYSEGG